MGKLLIFILLLIVCNTAYADNSHFVWDLPEKEGIKLLTGEKSIFLVMKVHSSIKDKLREDVVSDIKLKCLSIGLEISVYEWGTPFLEKTQDYSIRHILCPSSFFSLWPVKILMYITGKFGHCGWLHHDQ